MIVVDYVLLLHVGMNFAWSSIYYFCRYDATILHMAHEDCCKLPLFDRIYWNWQNLLEGFGTVYLNPRIDGFWTLFAMSFSMTFPLPLPMPYHTIIYRRFWLCVWSWQLRFIQSVLFSFVYPCLCPHSYYYNL